jgi:NAD(P)-dependent dehydrogenase (short-subunit alcohol dehydrogenase family)
MLRYSRHVVDPTPADLPASREVAGQVAVVTGGGRGLGREVASRLAAEGVRVAVAARTQDELLETVRLIEEAGGEALQVTTDVADAAAVQTMISQVERDLGPVDLLVNGAAVIAPLGPAWEVSADQWWRLLEINLRGSFLCARAVLTKMTDRRRGRIVNVASGAGLVPPPYGSAYVTSKAALIRLTEALALETKEYGIALFAIDPGWMSTAMTHELTYSEQGKKWTPWAPSMFGTKAHVSPERAAELIVTLASGRADSLSGRFLSIWDDVENLISNADDIVREDLHSMRLRTGGHGQKSSGSK